MGKLFRDTTGERIAEALEMLALNAGGKTGDSEWETVRNLVRAGMGAKAFPVGTQLVVKKETSMTASIGASTGITAASVSEETFLAAEGIVGTGIHRFTYDGSSWVYEGNIVNLDTYGITPTGTPAADDEIIITEAFNEVLFDVVDHWEVTDPVDGNTKPAMILLMHHVINDRQFDAPEALIYAAEAIPAGNYKVFITDDPWVSGDNNKYFYFTLTQQVPKVGQIVGSFTYNQTLEGKQIKTYSGPTSTSAIETATLSATEIADAVDLGTTRLLNVNDIARAKLGSNNYKESAIRQWINSKAAANGWYAGSNKFDRPASYANVAGLLHGMDQDFLDSVRALAVPCKTNNTFELDGWTLNTAYTLADKFWLASRDEVGFGVENVAEGSVLKAYSSAANVDRIKYDISSKSTARSWWLRSPNPSNSYDVRNVGTDGSLHTNSASIGVGVVAACAIM